jgi:predicted pore-forming effector associated with SMODS systems
MASQTGPRGIPGRPIHERQLDEDMVRLQRAAAASHQRGQLIEAIRVNAAVALAVAGIIVTLAGHGRTAVSITGAAWFAVSAFFLRRAAASTVRQGALLQEMFDITLFYLPWRPTAAGDEIPEPDVAQLARRLRPGSRKDQRILAGWYDPTGGVHHPYDVLIAQEQNLGWDARLRRRYATLVVAAAVTWSALGLTAGLVIAGATLVSTLVSFFIPSLAIYQIALEIWIGQQRVAAERQRLNHLVTAELRAARPGAVSTSDWRRLRDVARDIQDGILRTRLDVSRVPEWFYCRHRNRDELDFADTTEGHRKRLAT